MINIQYSCISSLGQKDKDIHYWINQGGFE